MEGGIGDWYSHRMVRCMLLAIIAGILLMCTFSGTSAPPVGEIPFQTGRRFHLEYVKHRPVKNLGDSETKHDTLYNDFQNPYI